MNFWSVLAYHHLTYLNPDWRPELHYQPMNFWSVQPYHHLADLNPDWRPSRHPELHYQALYRGVYEFLRVPPTVEYAPRASRYLDTLHKSRHGNNLLQLDRIRWTEAWILEVDEGDLSDAETVSGDS